MPHAPALNNTTRVRHSLLVRFVPETCRLASQKYSCVFILYAFYPASMPRDESKRPEGSDLTFLIEYWCVRAPVCHVEPSGNADTALPGQCMYTYLDGSIMSAVKYLCVLLCSSRVSPFCAVRAVCDAL